jgi:ribosome biogenesis GTPase
LASEEEITQVLSDYRGCGARLFLTSNQRPFDFDRLHEALHGHITVFSGVSGAGKSTLLGMLTRRELETGTLSKISRGKHTTRHSELIAVDSETYLMDTPGFSDLELSVSPDELWKYYPEFYEYSDCRFNSCLHLKEPDCGVKNAVRDGRISALRYENYVTLYEEQKETFKPY